MPLPQRLDSTLRVIYLVLNSGCAASSGTAPAPLARLSTKPLPDPETQRSPATRYSTSRSRCGAAAS